ncbi:Chaperone protein like [Actinidia chinensis var. chinensis]|uniref:Chaperone protein like n=1 Tax=Actinidia chinensis var. chinensis TaxID=1590841 RepID=A0A2R6PMJ8_ACTCC|nr:Chaperone protein like [Actinidia chinensis var. chinensis]
MSLTLIMAAPANLNSNHTKTKTKTKTKMKKILGFELSSSLKGRSLQPIRCTPLQKIEQQVEERIMCEPCNGTGWLLCDFCKGQKTNVKAANNRIYRRCPACKAIGCLLCTNCKVFKCVTFPNYNDGEDITF